MPTDESDDLNFTPLHNDPLNIPKKPDFVPTLDINKVLVIKNRRTKGLSVNALCERSDSFDDQSQSSDESLDSRGRPKRCPKPRVHKKILDIYGIQTGARNILELEKKIVKEKLQKMKK